MWERSGPSGTSPAYICSISSSPVYFFIVLSDLDNNMDDINNDHGVAAVATFLVTMYVLYFFVFLH
jgi:hypothetical protein